MAKIVTCDTARRYVVQIRLTAAEMADIKRAAIQAGETMSDYIRRAVAAMIDGEV